MCCFADDGKVVKAVSVIRDNWDTEEVVLEELTVFQVRRCKETGPPQCETVTQMCPVQTGAGSDAAVSSGRHLSGKTPVNRKRKRSGHIFPKSSNQTSCEEEERRRRKV